MQNDILNNDQRQTGNNIIININNHINNNLISNHNFLNTTGNKINIKENSEENIPKNTVNIIFNNSNRKLSELKNLDKDIRVKKQLSFNRDNDNDRNLNNINSNEKTEETKLNDEKIFEVKENYLYVTLNRLIYSENCLVFYYINIIFAVISLLLSLVLLLYVEKNFGNYLYIFA